MRVPKQQLANRLTVSQLARVYQEAEAKMRRAFADIVAAEKSINDCFAMDGPRISLSVHSLYFDDPDRSFEPMRREVWETLLIKADIPRVCSQARWSAIQQDLKREKPMDVTEATLNAFLGKLSVDLNDMLREKVEEVFDWLRPRESKYKRNSEYEVPNTVVIRYVVEQWSKYHNRWWLCSRAAGYIRSLESVFNALDGRGEIPKSYYGEIGAIIYGNDYDGEGETPHFKFKTFKNGNMHLTFKRPDLLAKFNALAGGARLRAKEDESAA